MIAQQRDELCLGSISLCFVGGQGVFGQGGQGLTGLSGVQE